MNATIGKEAHNILKLIKTGVPKDQIARLSSHTDTNCIVSIVIVSIVLAIVEFQVFLPWLYLWALLQLGLTSVIFLRNRKVFVRRKSQPRQLLSRKGFYLAALYAVFLGAMWGSLAFFVPYVPDQLQIALILIIGGMAAGGSATLAAVPQVSAMFTLACVLPITILYLTSSDPGTVALGLMFLVYGIAMIATSRIVFNYSERERRLQSRLQEAQKLESLGHLSAGIAHEINTPCQYVSDNMAFMTDAITSLEPFLQEVTALLMMREKNKDREETNGIARLQSLYETADVKYLLEELSAAVASSKGGMERIKKIVMAMRAYAHPSNKRVQLDLNEAIADILIVATSEWKHIAELVTDYEDNLPNIYCIPSEINQAILNIVVNAAHAIADSLDDGGMGKIMVSTSAKDGQVIIKISDTGPGIPEEIRKIMFSRFFTTKEVGKGTGLGLAIVHKIICESHKGSIAVDSILGKGSCFTICLPVNARATRT